MDTQAENTEVASADEVASQDTGAVTTPTTVAEIQDTGAAQTAEVVMEENKFAAVTGDAEFDNTIWSMCEAIEDCQNQTLKMNWVVGDIIQSHIDKHKPKNVSAALEEIVDYIHEATYGRQGDLAAPSLRKTLKLRQKISKEQLELAILGGISYRNILPMCKNDVTDDQRNDLLKCVTEGTLDQMKISDEVKALNPPSVKKENRGGARKKRLDHAGFMKRFKENMDDLLDMQANYRLHAATALGSEDETTKVEYAQFYEATAEQIEQLNEKWAANEKVNQVFLEE